MSKENSPIKTPKYTWILSIENKEPITPKFTTEILQSLQQPNKTTDIPIIVEERTIPNRSNFESMRSAFKQMDLVVNSLQTELEKIPQVSNIIKCKEKPEIPTDVRKMLEDTNRLEWIDSIFNNYTKMNESGSWEALIKKTDIPKDKKILRPRLVFKVKDTEFPQTYDLYTRTTEDE